MCLFTRFRVPQPDKRNTPFRGRSVFSNGLLAWLRHISYTIRARQLRISRLFYRSAGRNNTFGIWSQVRRMDTRRDSSRSWMVIPIRIQRRVHGIISVLGFGQPEHQPTTTKSTQTHSQPHSPIALLSLNTHTLVHTPRSYTHVTHTSIPITSSSVSGLLYTYTPTHTNPHF